MLRPPDWPSDWRARLAAETRALYAEGLDSEAVAVCLGREPEWQGLTEAHVVSAMDSWRDARQEQVKTAWQRPGRQGGES